MIFPESTGTLENMIEWPFGLVLLRMGMASGMGILIGLEREHSQKTGVRTFSLIALLGCMGGMMGDLFAVIAMFFVAMVIVGMNYKEIIRDQKLALTTSSALAVVGFAGVLFGKGHVFTPAVASVVTAALLAWKRPISRFALALSDRELQSAILLAILTVVILPMLPAHPVDPWGLVEPRSNWISVIIIAALGFVNYILMRLLGARGMQVTAFFGGLVNSRKVVVELAMRLREMGPALLPTVRQGFLLATAAMIIRNAAIVAIFALPAITYASIPLAVMLLANVILWWRDRAISSPADNPPVLALESPFKLSAALKFGLVFLTLNVVGALAQRHFGSASFYFVSVAGGLLSSGSSIASAATLISHGELPVMTGINGVILSSTTSILANIPLIRSLIKDTGLKKKTCGALILIASIGLIAGIFNNVLFINSVPTAGK